MITHCRQNSRVSKFGDRPELTCVLIRRRQWLRLKTTDRTSREPEPEPETEPREEDQVCSIAHGQRVRSRQREPQQGVLPSVQLPSSLTVDHHVSSTTTTSTRNMTASTLDAMPCDAMRCHANLQPRHIQSSSRLTAQMA